jgi:hypothetical protein
MAKTFGGTIRVLLDGAEVLKLDNGTLSESLGGFTYESAPNSNGTLDRTAKFDGYMVDLSARVNDSQAVDFDALMGRDGFAIQVVKETEGVIVTYFGAAFVGKPTLDGFTGSISGLQAHATRRQEA